ncbi:MAG: (2Fe-2S)-binding protein [Hoeflea sp.]|nr:(2Fe-2S)-binding protein [Hoeflea sp.]
MPGSSLIVCQCNILSRHEIERAVESLIANDPWRLIVRSTVYHAMRIRGRCCGCFPDVIEIIAEMTERMRPNNAPDG